MSEGRKMNKEHTVTLTWKGFARFQQDEYEVEIRLGKLRSRAEELVRKALQGTGKIVSSEMLPEKPLPNMPFQFRLTVVFLGQVNISFDLKKEVGSPVLSEFSIMLDECHQETL